MCDGIYPVYNDQVSLTNRYFENIFVFLPDILDFDISEHFFIQSFMHTSGHFEDYHQNEQA